MPRSRARSAASTALAPCSPAIMSASARGGSTGSRSAKPLREAKPDIASTSVPKPGSRLAGPVWPKPEMRTRIRSGAIACSRSGASPISSSTPGRKFSIMTSAVGISRSSAAMPSGLRRSSTTDSLLRDSSFQ